MIELRDWQVDAYSKIEKDSGIVVASTGSGKSFLGYKIIADNPNDKTLIVVPTIMLMNQWRDELIRLNITNDISRIGGGHRDMPATVTIAVINSLQTINLTHPNAYFDHVVFDEVHRYAAGESLRVVSFLQSPHKIGMTATLERPDEAHLDLIRYIGKVVYKMELGSVESNKYVSSFDIEVLKVSLTKEETLDYQASDAIMKMYFGMFNYNLATMIKSTKRFDGYGAKARKTQKAMQNRRDVIINSVNKRSMVLEIVKCNPDSKIVVFDERQENAEHIYDLLTSNGYKCSLYHSGQTKKVNKLQIDNYKNDITDILVTVRALDEGMNVPMIDLAIIANGNSQKRQFFQRLGRAIRKVEGKHARLSMIYCNDTHERNIIAKRMRFLEQ